MGAPNQNWQPTPPPDIVDLPDQRCLREAAVAANRLFSFRHKPADLPHVVRAQEAEQVVGHALALVIRNLVGDDGQAAIQLHGIRIDNFAVEGKRQFYGELLV